MQLCIFPWGLWQRELSTFIPQPQHQDWFPIAAALPGGFSSAELPISGLQWNLKQTSRIQNQSLFVLVSTRHLQTWWDLRHASVLLPCNGFITTPRCCLSSDTCRICSSAEPHLKTKPPPPFMQAAGCSLGWLHSRAVASQPKSTILCPSLLSSLPALQYIHAPALPRTCGALKALQEPVLSLFSAGAQPSPGSSLPQRSWRKVIAFIRWSASSLVLLCN